MYKTRKCSYFYIMVLKYIRFCTSVESGHIHVSNKFYLTLTLHSDIHRDVNGSSREWVGGYTGVYSFCTPMDICDLKNPLITDHNSLRTQPLYSGTMCGVRCITIQVQCVSFAEGGVPSDYWRPEN